MRNSSSPLYKGSLICSEDLSISFHKKKELKLDQCWAVGFSILEISKFIMQRLYYEKIVARLGSGCVSIIMSDTDSFLIEVKGLTETEVMQRLADVMDFSNLDPSDPLFDDSRRKIPGFLKNEIPKAIILEVVALKSKTYAIRTNKNSVLNKAKGVVEAIKNKIPFSQYKRCVLHVHQHEVTQKTLRSKNHINQMLECKKVAFSSFDDKRFLLCSKHSAPFGSFLTDEEGMWEGCYFCTAPNLLF